MRLVSAAAGLVALALSGAAAAAPDLADTARAEALFEEGLRLFTAGQTSPACAKFAESYKLDPGLGTLQNLALCHEKEGRLVLAYDELTVLLTKAQAAGQTARVDVAIDHLAGLDAKVPHVVLSFAGGVHVGAVEVDGAERDWRAPIALEVGHHVITAHAEGFADARVEYEATVGGTKAVQVQFTATAPVAPPPPSALLERPATTSPQSRKLAVLGLAGLAGAGVVVGSIFGVLTFSEKGAEAGHCSGAFCDKAGLSADDQAHAYATASTVGFAVGLAALALDAVLVVTSSRSDTFPFVARTDDLRGVTLSF